VTAGQAETPAQPVLRVRAVDASGAPAADFALAHGDDPARELRRLGWVVESLEEVATQTAPAHTLTLAYRVRAARQGDPPPPPDVPVPRDRALVLEPGEEAHRHQRTAAYALVASERGILLTQLAASTSAAGQWNLPGGGVDPGESPLETLHREVWEETGQVIVGATLLEVQTSHWVGRAPSGRLEDFHAVRVVYAADCPEPSDPVVHDVGGSTADARWVARRDLRRYRVTRSFAPHLRRWLGEGRSAVK
jgi:8-oxo-dGTP diphosphatase